MKILCLCSFDPCGVARGHAELLRQAGHEYLLAHAVTEQVRDFAAEAHVIQVCPGIGDGGGWSIEAGAFDSRREPPNDELTRQLWAKARPDQVWVAYFHGSVATWAARFDYARHYLRAGFKLATSTLDYAHELPATYLPPCLPALPLAKLREPGEPLLVSHTPTNPSNCNTQAFLALTHILKLKGVPLVATYASGVPHEEALALKLRAHAHFDHLRGSFSVNTLEAAAMGLVPLVGLEPAYVADAQFDGIRALRPVVRTLDDLRDTLVRLADDVAVTRNLQEHAHRWFKHNFNPVEVTMRLTRFYEGLVK